MKPMRFRMLMAAGVCALFAPATMAAATPPSTPNVLVFVVDDMDFTTFNADGCPVPGLMPNLERLARDGLLFDNAHVPNAVCQPSRQSMMTGLHPHRNGSLGFLPVPKGVPNLSELLMQRGYYTASFNKGRDYQSFPWSEFVAGYGTRGFGYDPGSFAEGAKKAIAKAKSEGKPFFLNVATADPHRPFPGSRQEEELLAKTKVKWPKQAAQGQVFFPPFTNVCSPSQAWIPPFLPDLPKIREEWSQYYNAVHRADDTLGRILKLLKEEGVEANTMVFFFSDNGASFPTDKQNCYPYSTRTPLVVRWPGVIEPGRVDREHMVSTMDILPTLLEVTAIPPPAELDGRSLLPLLGGKTQEGRDHVFTTQNYITPGNQVYPMRAVHTQTYSYLFNAWVDGKTRFTGECLSGLTFAAMQEAAKTDPALAARVRHIEYRVGEELYDLKRDPACLRNLAKEPEHSGIKATLKKLMEEEMRRTGDPLLPAFLGEGGIPAGWSTSK